MLIQSTGAFTFGEESPYEFEATYQLKYLLSSALISLDYIEFPNQKNFQKFPNEIQYYRYYLDHLFFLIGQIHDRFIIKNNNSNSIKKECIKLNRNNYGFDENKYVTISNKVPRNIIEHLDERSLYTIEHNGSVGGFNVIFQNSDKEFINTIKNQREFYPYILNLIDNVVHFHNFQTNNSKVIDFDISLKKLREEILILSKNVDNIYSFFVNTTIWNRHKDKTSDTHPTRILCIRYFGFLI